MKSSFNRIDLRLHHIKNADIVFFYICVKIISNRRINIYILNIKSLVESIWYIYARSEGRAEP